MERWIFTVRGSPAILAEQQKSPPDANTLARRVLADVRLWPNNNAATHHMKKKKKKKKTNINESAVTPGYTRAIPQSVQPASNKKSLEIIK